MWSGSRRRLWPHQAHDRGGVPDASRRRSSGVLRMQPALVKAVAYRIRRTRLARKVRRARRKPRGRVWRWKTGVVPSSTARSPDAAITALDKGEGRVPGRDVSPALPYALFGPQRLPCDYEQQGERQVKCL